MKTKITLLWMAALALFSVTTVNAQVGDLSVTALNVTRVNGNVITMSYTVKNVGGAALNLAARALQTYVSTDNVFSPNTDISAGTARFTAGPVVLLAGESYSGTFVATGLSNAVNLYQHYYLFFNVIVRAGHQDTDPNAINNRKFVDLRPRFADLSVQDIGVLNVNGNTARLFYTVRNTAAVPLNLSKFYYYGYLSPTENWSDGTLLTTGIYYPINAPAQLLPGESFTGIWTINAPVSLQDNPFLIFTTLSNPIEYELNTANNRFIRDMRPNFSDLVVKDLSISQINGTSVTYNYTVKNQGGDDAYLDRFLFQSYLSRDGVLSSDDVLASVAPFEAYRLMSGGEYSGQVTCSANLPLETYRYLIFNVQLLGVHANPQISLSNDRYSKDMMPNFADLEVLDINILEATPDTIDYSYTVRNRGVDTLHLERFIFFTQFSTDQIVGGDVWGVQAYFSTEPLRLAPGQVYSASSTTPVTASLQTHPYMIFVATPFQYEPQQRRDNDTFAKFVTASNARAAAFQLQTAEEAVIVENVSAKEQTTSYVLYTLNGETIAEGSFQSKEQITTAGLTAGLYLIRLSDGDKVETLKFVVQ